MKNRQQVSFIVPVYGVERYLSACIDSIRNQTLESWELILVDDGSPDNCGAICDFYASQDPRITVIHKQNEGVSAARNDGINAANGRWLYFVDSDDWLEPNAAEILVNEASRLSVDCVMSYPVRVFPDGSRRRSKLFSSPFVFRSRKGLQEIQQYVLYQPYSRYYTKETVNGYAAPWAKFVRASVVKDNPSVRFDPYLKGVFDDGLFSLELLEVVDSLAYIDAHTYNYRIVEGSLTHSFRRDAIDIQERGYSRIRQFARRSRAKDEIMEALAAHIIAFYGGYLTRYYFHPDRSESTSEVHRELRAALERQPYAGAPKAARNAPLLLKDRFLATAISLRSIPLSRAYALARQIRGVK